MSYLKANRKDMLKVACIIKDPKRALCFEYEKNCEFLLVSKRAKPKFSMDLLGAEKTNTLLCHHRRVPARRSIPLVSVISALQHTLWHDSMEETESSPFDQEKAYILATCTALGGFEDRQVGPDEFVKVYSLGDQALGK